MASDDDPGWSLRFAENSALTTRQSIARQAGLQFGSDRDLYDVLGWKRVENRRVEDYWSAYLTNPMARVIVNAPAATSWRVTPEIHDDADTESETEFEAAIADLHDEFRFLHYLERADKVAGIGEFGVIVFGFADDADSMAEPIDQGSLSGLDDLNYLATFSQNRVTDLDLVEDPTDERYGLPERYDIQFGAGGTDRSRQVHWTRVIHVAEDLLEDEVYGRPRLEAVFNTLYDLEKVLGGAAEMTWRGAGLRMQLDIDPEMGAIPDAEEVAEQAEEMVMGLRHIMRTRGTDMNVIEGETVDPSGITDVIFKILAGETGIPQRILTGSERGELASTQDRATFYGRMGERQLMHNEAQMYRPAVDRLIWVGVLPKPQGETFTLDWPDLFELSELEQAELMTMMAEAIKTAAPAGDPGQLAVVEEIRQNILDWEPQRGAEVDDSVELGEELLEELPETDADREAFEEILRDAPDGDAFGDPDADPLATDGGED